VGLEPTSPHYGCGVLAAGRPVPDFQMGPEGLEPSPASLRARYAAANTLIPCRCSSASPIGSEGVEPSSGSYKKPALTVELRAVRLTETAVRVGPEGIEPSPARLKVCCAAVTPRPREPVRGGRLSRRAVISSLLKFVVPVSAGTASRLTFFQRHRLKAALPAWPEVESNQPLPPYQSDMLPLQHRATSRGGGNRTR
jgi:hypothetical protein